MIFRSWVNIVVALIIATVIATVALASVAWSMSSRLTPIQRYLAASIEVEKAIIELESRMIKDDSTELSPEARQALLGLLKAIDNLAQKKNEFELTVDADSLLFVADWNLSLAREENRLTENIIKEGVYHIRRALNEEIALRTQVLKSLERRTLWVYWFTVSVALCLLVIMIILVWLMKNRLFQPLQSLRQFLHKVERREYASFSGSSVDPLLEPLVTQYNIMVEKLKQYEQTNHNRQKTLSDEVRNVSRALIEQQVALSRAQQQAAAGEVSASIAHEVRNPMAGMAMALASLKDDLDDPESIERVEMVIDELNRVNRLLNNLLDKARVRPEKVDVMSLQPVIKSLVQLVRYQIPEGIKLRVEIPATLKVRMPEAALRQAVLNLVLNAAQALGSAGEIVIAAECAPRHLKITVSDNGPGYPEELLRNGIQPYNTQRSFGAGLGLATVRRFVQNQDGELKLANRDEGGAVATLNLPKEKCVENE